jgi:hypothetical protein
MRCRHLPGFRISLCWAPLVRNDGAFHYDTISKAAIQVGTECRIKFGMTVLAFLVGAQYSEEKPVRLL